MSKTKLGTARYGSEYTKKKYFKFGKNVNEIVARIVPPLGDLADDGRWSMFYRVHYGYRNSKGEMKVFQSTLVKNRKSGMVEVPDAALERIEKLKAQLEAAKAAKDSARVEKINDLLQSYNLDSNHYMNIIDREGNIGILKLRHKAKLALDAEIKRLRAEGTDPLSVEDGRFFVFRRSGTGTETIFSVSVLTESLDVPGVGRVQRPVVHKLDEATIERLGTEAGELDKLYKKLSSDDVARIVSTADLATGKSAALDELFGSNNSSGSSDDGEDYGDEDDSSSTSTASATPAAAKVELSPAPAPVAAAPAPTPAPAPTSTAAKIESQSHEDFLKSLNL